MNAAKTGIKLSKIVLKYTFVGFSWKCLSLDIASLFSKLCLGERLESLCFRDYPLFWFPPQAHNNNNNITTTTTTTTIIITIIIINNNNIIIIIINNNNIITIIIILIIINNLFLYKKHQNVWKQHWLYTHTYYLIT